jgi:hypothetical protein
MSILNHENGELTPKAFALRLGERKTCIFLSAMMRGDDATLVFSTANEKH